MSKIDNESSLLYYIIQIFPDGYFQLCTKTTETMVSLQCNQLSNLSNLKKQQDHTHAHIYHCALGCILDEILLFNSVQLQISNNNNNTSHGAGQTLPVNSGKLFVCSNLFNASFHFP